MKSLAQRFNEALAAAQVSKKELADSIGVSPSAITQIANGETKELKASFKTDAGIKPYCSNNNPKTTFRNK